MQGDKLMMGWRGSVLIPHSWHCTSLAQATCPRSPPPPPNFPQKKRGAPCLMTMDTVETNRNGYKCFFFFFSLSSSIGRIFFIWAEMYAATIFPFKAKLFPFQMGKEHKHLKVWHSDRSPPSVAALAPWAVFLWVFMTDLIFSCPWL